MSAPVEVENWAGEDIRLADVERAMARLRNESTKEGAPPNLRTSVMTHLAWVPEAWLEAARGVLGGMAELHPSRTILLVPLPDTGKNQIDATVSLECYAVPGVDRNVCSEVVELHLHGPRAKAPASIVEPLLISDLPVFLRWRGEPPFGEVELDGLVGVADRLIIDSSEWNELRYDELAELFPRAVVSDIAWARTHAWRLRLAGCWPGIREQEIRIRGPRAEASLLAGWLNARLDRAIRPIEPAGELGVRLGGEQLAPPSDPAASPSDLLSAELDRFARDPIYEEAVGAAARA